MSSKRCPCKKKEYYPRSWEKKERCPESCPPRPCEKKKERCLPCEKKERCPELWKEKEYYLRPCEKKERCPKPCPPRPCEKKERCPKPCEKKERCPESWKEKERCPRPHLDATVRELLLWNDHYYLTRQVIVAAVYGTGCLGPNLDALYANQSALGANFGELTSCKKAGVELAELLTVHIDIAVMIVTAAIKGDPTDALYASWVANGEEIAETYNKYNKCIKLSCIRDDMLMHLETTLQEALDIIGNDCAASEVSGAIALEHVQSMALYIASAFD